MNILDLGCGTGFFTRILAKEYKNSEIIGMDINEELLNAAKEIIQREGLNIKFEIGDITDIKYDDNTFDIVLCDIMLECFEDITVPLNEMKRVCKSGGVVACIEPFYQSGFEYYPEADDETRDLIMKFSRKGRAFGVGPMMPNYLHNVGLNDIDLISWFWGGINYKELEMINVDEKLRSMEGEIKHLKTYSQNDNNFNDAEKIKIINFYEERLIYYKSNPDKLKNDMSVKGLPVFIVKGHKK